MKFIAISQRLISNESYYEERECLALDWGKFFKENLQDFLPIPLSYELEFEKYQSLVSAVILSGGNDLYFLNKNDLSKKRDDYETEIIKICIRENIPLLGICRGAQMIASFFNSTFITKKEHTREHAIYLNDKKIHVNSFHNFCINKLGNDLESLAFAEDKTIEAFKHKQFKIYATMWHIEREYGLNEKSVFHNWLKEIK
ncbi:gamma-glutamyl-CDP-amidate hydrolase [Campylobacter insulaenigrae]|uniref:gamma-glutamyl-CDP-amidate hydrolase n=1 Tax=Campylobacter insulaenigrae TaxID=260714 RepID=UPI002430AF68|nr:gamma-glutamyl-CDP-amidate hydrolase [Campylobacter insulaenigrae]